MANVPSLPPLVFIHSLAVLEMVGFPSEQLDSASQKTLYLSQIMLCPMDEGKGQGLCVSLLPPFWSPFIPSDTLWNQPGRNKVVLERYLCVSLSDY